MVAVKDSRLRIEDLDISIGDPMNCIRPANMNHINPHDCIVPSMLIGPYSAVLEQPILGGLRRLSVCLDPGVSGEKPSSWESDIAYFFGLLPQLSDLRLKFGDCDDQERFPALCSTLYIPKLEGLTLDSVRCTGTDLTRFLLRHHETLRDISLISVDLSDGIEAWCRLVKMIRDLLDVSSFSMLDSLGSGTDLECVSSEIDIPEHLEATSVWSLDRIACLLHRAA